MRFFLLGELVNADAVGSYRVQGAHGLADLFAHGRRSAALAADADGGDDRRLPVKELRTAVNRPLAPQ